MICANWIVFQRKLHFRESTKKRFIFFADFKLTIKKNYEIINLFHQLSTHMHVIYRCRGNAVSGIADMQRVVLLLLSGTLTQVISTRCGAQCGNALRKRREFTMLSNIFTLSNKGLGFYASAIAAVVSFISAFIYRITYTGNPYYTNSIFYTLLSVLPVAIILLLVRLDSFIPAAITLIIGIAALRFIYSMYFDISVVMVGIDKTSFDSEFIICSILFALCFILSEASIYMRMRK